MYVIIRLVGCLGACVRVRAVQRHQGTATWTMDFLSVREFLGIQTSHPHTPETAVAATASDSRSSCSSSSLSDSSNVSFIFRCHAIPCPPRSPRARRG